MTLREAAQQALEALEHGWIEKNDAVAAALRAALAEPGNDYERGFVDGMSNQAKSSVDKAVNSMTRKPLTDEQIEELCWTEMDRRLLSFARAIERAHGIGEKT